MNNATRFSIIIFLLGLFIISFYSILFCKIQQNGNFSNYDAQIFNLIYYTSPIFWIATFLLSILTISFIFFSLSKKFLPSTFIEKIVTALTLILLMLFYGLPYFIEPNPRFIDSWVHGRTAKGILENGKLQPEEYRYQAYPSSFIFLSYLSMITKIEITSLLRITPLIYIVIFFTTLTIFFKESFNDLKIANVSTLIYGLSTFYLAFHFSPEIFGWISFFIFGIVVAKELLSGSKHSKSARRYSLLLTLTVIGVTFTHLVTQFMVILLMLTFILLKQKMDNKIITYNRALFAAVFFIAYSLFFSVSYTYGVIEGFKRAFETVLFEAASSIAAQPFTAYYPQEVFALILYRRMLYIAVITTAVFGAYLLKKEKKRQFAFLSALVIVSIILTPLTVFGILPLERSIKLAFIPFSAFSSYLIMKKRRIGIIFLSLLLLTLPINFASFYWNEAGRYLTHDWEVSSAQFLSVNFHGVILAEYKETAILKFYGKFSKIYDDFHIMGERPNIFNSTFIKEENIKMVQITQITVLRESWAKRNLDINYYLSSPSFNCIYSSDYSVTLSNNYAK